MSSSLLLQQCGQHGLFILLGKFVRWKAGDYTAVVLWLCCFQGLFKTACSILMQFNSSFFGMLFIRVNLVQPYRHNNSLEEITFYFIKKSNVYMRLQKKKKKEKKKRSKTKQTNKQTKKPNWNTIIPLMDCHSCRHLFGNTPLMIPTEV